MKGLCKPALLCAAIFLLVLGSSAALAEANNCSRVGTWMGDTGTGITWTDIATAGRSATEGQLDLEWTKIDPTLGGFPTVRITNGKGTWQHVSGNTYRFTWVAYGLDAGSQPFFISRASGQVKMTNCNTIEINYTLEIFAAGQDIWTEQPMYGVSIGYAVEKRMPVVQP